jgi:DNA-binding NtrC family response regulator
MAHILIIDDDETIRSMLAEYLSEHGYTVSTAESGQRALATLAATPVDLVITDIVMADKDGVEIIRSLRKTTPSIPIIAMSGGAQLPADFYLDVAQGLGAIETFSKPFKNRQLLEAVQRCLQNRSGLASE